MHSISRFSCDDESSWLHLVTDFEKNISLAIIDDAWKTHLRKMDELELALILNDTN